MRDYNEIRGEKCELLSRGRKTGRSATPSTYRREAITACAGSPSGRRLPPYGEVCVEFAHRRRSHAACAAGSCSGDDEPVFLRHDGRDEKRIGLGLRVACTRLPSSSAGLAWLLPARHCAAVRPPLQPALRCRRLTTVAVNRVAQRHAVIRRRIGSGDGERQMKQHLRSASTRTQVCAEAPNRRTRTDSRHTETGCVWRCEPTSSGTLSLAAHKHEQARLKLKKKKKSLPARRRWPSKGVQRRASADRRLQCVSPPCCAIGSACCSRRCVMLRQAGTAV